MNIVFDLGGVVFNWDPDAIIRRVFQDPEKHGFVKAEVFEHDDWVALDKGAIAPDQAIVRAMSRTGLPRDALERLLSEVPRSLTPIPGTMDLIQSVRSADNRLFVLSNMQLESITYLEQQYKIWNAFDGVVISSRINKVKPDLEIYEHLLTEYQLDASETVFIDDLIENLEAASRLGIKTIRFISASQCRRELLNLKCV